MDYEKMWNSLKSLVLLDSKSFPDCGTFAEVLDIMSRLEVETYFGENAEEVVKRLKNKECELP